MVKPVLKTLRKTISREEFEEKYYNKSKSWGSKCVLSSALKNLDFFIKLNFEGFVSQIIDISRLLTHKLFEK